MHEIGVVSEQHLEVDGCFVKQHTGDNWGCLVAESALDRAIDVVSNEGLSLFALESIELLNINGSELELLHLLWKHWGAWLTSWSWNWWLWHTSWCWLLGLVDVILLLTTLALLLTALLILVVSASALSSTTASVATSTSVGSVSLVITIPTVMLITALVASIVHTWSITEFLLAHDVSDELFKASGTFLFCLLLQVILSLPEVDLKGLGAVTKAVRSVEHLDTFLCGLNISIENVSELIVGESFTIDSLSVILQFDRGNVTCGLEFLSEHLLSHMLWDVSNEDVGLEGLLLVPDDWLR